MDYYLPLTAHTGTNQALELTRTKQSGPCVERSPHKPSEGFTKGSDRATVFVFSSHQVFSEALDELLDFGWYLGWVGDLHVTLAVHTMFAQSVPLCSECTQVLEALYSIG